MRRVVALDAMRDRTLRTLARIDEHLIGALAALLDARPRPKAKKPTKRKES
jgi:hypothetical protein